MNALFCFTLRRWVEKKTLRVENFLIFYYLQSLLTNSWLIKINLFNLKLNLPGLSRLLLNSYFWYLCSLSTISIVAKTTWQTSLVKTISTSSYWSPETANVGAVCKKRSNKGDQRARLKKDSWKKRLERVLNREELLYMPETLRRKLMTRHYDKPLVSHSKIKKTCKLITQKYYRLIL